MKNLSKKNKIFGAVFLVLFIIVQTCFYGKYEGNLGLAIQAIGILFLGISLSNLIPKTSATYIKNESKKLSKRTIFSMLMVLIAVPLTIFTGFYFLDDKKYYFVSLLIIIEIMIPFFMSFEGKKPQARELVIISVLCACAVAGRAAFFMLPQFKPIIAIVIISGVCFGGETGFLIGAVTGFVSNFMYGQGSWTPWQMFSFGIIGFLAGVLFSKGLLKGNKIVLSVFGGLATVLIFGVIMNISSVILWQSNPTWEMIITSLKLGLPFDLIHAVSTVFFIWVFSDTLIEKIERVKTKYGIKITEM